jgi:Zn-dependent M28 family amino/carboxypeptidase
MRCSSIALVLCAALAGCRKDAPSDAKAQASAPAPSPSAATTPADLPEDLPAVDVALLRRHIAELSSDAYAGRRPGTEGGKKTVAYLEQQMRALGLEPAGEDGTFRQSVPMRGVRADATRTTAALHPKKGAPVELRPVEQIVVGSYTEAGTTQFDAELVFVGYGITAPEYEWDDYADVDLEGKIAVVLVGDPPVEDGRFADDAMTYYGRWSYKFERALQAGALGCLVIHETEPASYGWEVVRNSWSGERFHILEPGGALPPALTMQGWLHADAAARAAELAGGSLERWHEAALRPGFRAVATGVDLRGEVVTTERRVSDVNVIGRIPGADKAEQSVIVTAHWDHLGTREGAAPGEDAIFNGAVDNASGIAGLLATATGLQRRRSEGQTLSRSVILLATTAEEQGLLGSRHYAAHPLTDLAEVAGVINLDSMNVFGRTTTVQVIGAGQSTLEDVLDEVVRDQGRTLVPEANPEAGSYYRSDHFPFAKRGVPAMYFRGGPVMEEGGREAGEKLWAQRNEHYHTVDDELDDAWPLTGALQDVDALIEVVARVANAPSPPTWKPASEFASISR